MNNTLPSPGASSPDLNAHSPLLTSSEVDERFRALTDELTAGTPTDAEVNDTFNQMTAGLHTEQAFDAVDDEFTRVTEGLIPGAEQSQPAAAETSGADSLRVRAAAASMLLSQVVDTGGAPSSEMSADEAAQAYNEATGQEAQQEAPKSDWVSEAQADLAKNPDAGKDALEAVEQNLQDNAKRVIANAEYGLGDTSHADWNRDVARAQIADQERMVQRQQAEELVHQNIARQNVEARKDKEDDDKERQKEKTKQSSK